MALPSCLSSSSTNCNPQPATTRPIHVTPNTQATASEAAAGRKARVKTKRADTAKGWRFFSSSHQSKLRRADCTDRTNQRAWRKTLTDGMGYSFCRSAAEKISLFIPAPQAVQGGETMAACSTDW
ncbi:unnamed protein product [Ectocarpus sp. 4 AP-2014]